MSAVGIEFVPFPTRGRNREGNGQDAHVKCPECGDVRAINCSVSRHYNVWPVCRREGCRDYGFPMGMVDRSETDEIFERGRA